MADQVAKQQGMFLEELSQKEIKRREELETYVIENIKTFVQVGMALGEINKNRLYRSTHKDFAGYCEDILAISESRSYQLMDASFIVEEISTNCGDLEIVPKSECQVRPLVKYKKEPEKLLEFWRKAVTTAPKGKVTGKHVQATITDMIGGKVAKTIQRTRVAVNEDELISSEFSEAFDIFLKAVENARNGKYKTTSREAVLRHLDTIRSILADDGAYIKDQVAAG